MPKGVEHFNYIYSCFVEAVAILSLMPKGVEHEDRFTPRRSPVIVVLSLMPKGVEHRPPMAAASVGPTWFYL